MTLTSVLHMPEARKVPYGSETILLLGKNSDTRAFLRETLSTHGYRFLEAANFQHADAISSLLEGDLDLILASSSSNVEAFKISDWYTSRSAVPILVLPTGNHSTPPDLYAAEVALRVRLALEAANPPKSVMVVDNDASERRIIADLLETAGYHTAQAPDGKEALDQLARNVPDILLTDIVMPERDGFELIQDVRRYHFKTTIIAMSGAASSDSYLSIARLLGAKETLRKPLLINQLLRALREAPSAQ